MKKDEKKTKRELLTEITNLRARLLELDLDAPQPETPGYPGRNWRQLLFEAGPYIVYIINTDGDFIDVNPLMLKMVGVSLDEIRHMKIYDLFAGDNLEGIIRAREELSAGREVHNFQVRCRNKKGELFDFEVDSFPLLEGGRVTLALNIAKDITAYKKAVEELKKSEEQHRLFFDASPDFIYVVDEEGRLIETNKAFQKRIGLSGEELKQKTVMDFFAGDNLEELVMVRNQLLQGRETKGFITSLRNIQGELFRVEINSITLTSADGKIRFLSMLRDITERVQAERELKTSEERYRLHFQSITDVVCSFDHELRIIDISPSIENLLGYRPEEIIGKKIEELKVYFSEAQDQINRDIALVTSGKGVREAEYKFIAKSGAVKTVSISTSPLMQDGKVVSMISIVRDITERKQYEESRRYHELFDHVRDFILVLDGEDNILAVNNAACEALDYAREELQKIKLADIINLEQTLLVKEQFAKLRQEEKATFETVLKSKTEKLIYVETDIRPITYMGKPAILSVSRDISHSRVLSRELARRNRELESILYTASHDLKAPVVTIEGFAELLLEMYGESIPTQARDFAVRIRKASISLENLISDLVKIVRAEREVVNPTHIAFSAILNIAWAMLEPKFIEKKVAFKMAEDFPVVFADPDRLSQVLINLISNALRFMGDHREPTVTVGWRREVNKLVFFVNDNGIGIDPKYHSKIFDPFYRVQDLTCEGSGIGLALVKMIVEQHGGRIWVESAKGQGSTFYFTLPEGH